MFSFLMTCFFLHRTAKKFFAFMKATVHAFVIHSHVPYSTLIDWLILKDEQFDWFAWNLNSTLGDIVNSLRWSVNI